MSKVKEEWIDIQKELPSWENGYVDVILLR